MTILYTNVYDKANGCDKITQMDVTRLNKGIWHNYTNGYEKTTQMDVKRIKMHLTK